MRSREQTVRKKQISNTYLKTCVEDKNDLKITALTQVLEAILIIFFFALFGAKQEQNGHP